MFFHCTLRHERGRYLFLVWCRPLQILGSGPGRWPSRCPISVCLWTVVEAVDSWPRWQDPCSSFCLSLVAAASKVEQKELEVAWRLRGSSFYELH